MSHLLPARWLACLTVMTVLGASAQAVRAPTPLPSASAPAAQGTAAPERDRPALEGYQPFTDEPIRPWKESNDTVGRIGGWRAYAREAQGEGAPPPLSQPAATDPHAGHGGKAK